MKKNIIFLVGISAIIICGILYEVQTTHDSSSKTSTHYSADVQERVSLYNLWILTATDQCPTSENTKVVYQTQAYRSEAFKDDRNWLTSHYNKAFSQGEWACGSNSLDTALYGQKAMIWSFVAQLEEIEKKKWKQPQYDYVRQKAAELKALAWTRSMRQWEWLTELWYGTLDIQKRPLTIIDWLEAFFPNIIDEVKSRSTDWYTPDDIYDDVQNWVYTNWYEFVDSTINLSLPLNSPERSKPRRKQELFREFVTRTFDPYDAAHYLATINNNQDERLNNASQNPRLSNGKTLYTMYKEWLLDFKKFTPYVSNLDKLHGTNGNPTTWTQPSTSNGQPNTLSPSPKLITDPSPNTLTNQKSDYIQPIQKSTLWTPWQQTKPVVDTTTIKPTSSATTRILKYGVQVIPTTNEKTSDVVAPELPASLPPFGSRTLRF